MDPEPDPDADRVPARAAGPSPRAVAAVLALALLWLAALALTCVRWLDALVLFTTPHGAEAARETWATVQFTAVAVGGPIIIGITARAARMGRVAKSAHVTAAGIAIVLALVYGVLFLG